ncbi:MAG: 23S rRNA (pseudouridine(1915)-N(3))-methyltransferase RlmH [Ruminococcus sp.]|uniref:23S rRNA (pseudouridine(1915)-N(3))-methyltransferase RlmH n=1 Tax=Ruminococcus sp. TaxID=41978 RepID=UPI002873B3B1|nr:23S rRNA (pseudouridine(1915)-N(3))-methyltransferase RlmH [Ruminococcus sp.]MBQ3285297.1 23S rRNA (pseudouridine(1915)-N(3))-methyltransferase RlmH [Ruminococcus sp.]
MLTINIICVGKLKESYLRGAVEEYSKRMKPLCKLNIIELGEERVGDNPSDAEIQHTITAESDRIMQKIGKGDYVIAMCVEGKNISSEELSSRLESISMTHSTVDLIIGGSWGLSDSLKARADFKLSMGKMTFPHQLCRVMLLEQLYRAFQISKGTKYHK